jgi:DNA-binding MarR family transcriptional regulator
LSKVQPPKYLAAMPDQPADPVDAVLDQWRALRPDLPLDAMGTFIRLGRFRDLAAASIDATFGRHGLSIGEFDVLATLHRDGPPHELAPSAIARTLALSPAGMTNRVDRLEAAGLVERRADPDDRRSTRVRLTAEGQARVDAAVADHVTNEERLLAPLSKAERSELDRLLARLLAALREEQAAAVRADGTSPTSTS